MSNSGIVGYVNTKTSITIKFANGTAYRYDVSDALSKDMLDDMVKLAKSGKGLNSYLNKHPHVRKYGYLDDTLRKGSYHLYG